MKIGATENVIIKIYFLFFPFYNDLVPALSVEKIFPPT